MLDTSGFIDTLCDQTLKNNAINPMLYENFEIKRGLRNSDGTGVMAGFTRIGNVQGYVIADGEKSPIEGRLIYRGYDLEELIASYTSRQAFGFEEVAYLLLFGDLPNRERMDMFHQLLLQSMTLPSNFTEDMIIKAPSHDVMNKLGRSVLALYSYDDHPDNTSLPNLIRQSIELIARFPTIVAHAYCVKRHYFDGQSLFLHRPDENLTLAENFLRLIRPDSSFTAEEAKLLDLCLIMHAEHGGGNNSAFACRVLSSSGTDTYSAISAAVGSLKGPKHGGANNQVMNMFDEIKANVSDWADDDEVRGYLVKILNKGAGDGSGLIYGMGHAVYTMSDPRAVLLKKAAKGLLEKGGLLDEFNLMQSIERLTPEAFSKTKNDNKAMCANVDMYSGLVYQALGIPRDLFTPLFAVSRIVGWCAHRIEEVTTCSRIIRPAYKSAVPIREYIPMERR